MHYYSGIIVFDERLRTRVRLRLDILDDYTLRIGTLILKYVRIEDFSRFFKIFQDFSRFGNKFLRFFKIRKQVSKIFQDSETSF
jgi:hypothetical protein